MNYKLFFIAGIIVMLSGCSSTFNKQTLQVRHKGIIDACYTVLEYNPTDKEERINNYLEQKKQMKQITESQKIIIKECLNRTEISKKWSK